MTVFSRDLACFLILILCTLCLPEVTCQVYSNHPDTTRAEIIAKRLHKGIVLDVTPQYLDYQLADSTGFKEDSLIIGLFHMYHPSSFTHWITHLGSLPGWKEEVREELSYPVAWSELWQKPILLSKWGAWAPPSRYLISISKGKSYKISFLARSLSGNGILSIRLTDVSGSTDGFWTSDPVVISGKLKEYSFQQTEERISI